MAKVEPSSQRYLSKVTDERSEGTLRISRIYNDIKAKYGAEELDPSVKLAYPTYLPFIYVSKSTIGKFLFGERLSDILYFYEKKYIRSLNVTYLVLLAVWCLVVFEFVPSNWPLLVFLIGTLNGSAFFFYLKASSRVCYVLLERFEIQFAILNVVGVYLLYYSIEPDVKKSFLILGESIVPIFSCLFIDAYPGVGIHRRLIETTSVSLFLLFLALVLKNVYSPGVSEVSTSIQIGGIEKTISWNNLLFSCILNLTIVSFKTIYIQYQNFLGQENGISYKFSSLKSPVEIIVVRRSIAETLVTYSSAALLERGGYFGDVNISSDDKVRSPVHLQKPFIFSYKESLALMLFGEKFRNFIFGIGNKGILPLCYGVSIPVQIISVLRYLEYEADSNMDYWLVVLGWISSVPPMLFFNTTLMKHVLAQFEARFLILNVIGYNAFAYYLLSPHTSSVLSFTFIPIMIIGIFGDSHPAKRWYDRLTFVFISLFGLSFVAVLLFFSLLGSPSKEFFYIAGVKLSVADRCFGFLVNLVILFLRMLYLIFRRPSGFVFIRFRMGSTKMHRKEIDMMRLIKPQLIVKQPVV